MSAKYLSVVGTVVALSLNAGCAADAEQPGANDGASSSSAAPTSFPDVDGEHIVDTTEIAAGEIGYLMGNVHVDGPWITGNHPDNTFRAVHTETGETWGYGSSDETWIVQQSYVFR